MAEDAYPPDVVQVRNTFIHVSNGAEEGEGVHVMSCPASQIGFLEKLFEEMALKT